MGSDRRMSEPPCVRQGMPQGQTESGGIVLAAMYLPTFSHLLNFNEIPSLSSSSPPRQLFCFGGVAFQLESLTIQRRWMVNKNLHNKVFLTTGWCSCGRSGRSCTFPHDRAMIGPRAGSQPQRTRPSGRCHCAERSYCATHSRNPAAASTGWSWKGVCRRL